MGKCLWRATDGRCVSCKCKRIRADVLRIEDYEYCRGEEEYADCEFYKELPKR
ncbi:MAG: hypothetical protein GX224_06160 [Thermoplasmatales archaeon]|nr:hypothetical protein [Thermoplasmatales archaeon]